MTCPVANCRAVPRRGNLMCKRHWAMVPYALQKGIWSSWSSFTLNQNALAQQQYRDAVAAAVDAVNEVEASKCD